MRDMGEGIGADTIEARIVNGWKCESAGHDLESENILTFPATTDQIEFGRVRGLDFTGTDTVTAGSIIRGVIAQELELEGHIVESGE